MSWIAPHKRKLLVRTFRDDKCSLLAAHTFSTVVLEDLGARVESARLNIECPEQSMLGLSLQLRGAPIARMTLLAAARKVGADWYAKEMRRHLSDSLEAA